MKKLYRKGQVHPSPSPSPSPSPPTPSSDQFSLSYLPAAILTLAATLSPQDKEVLAYLLSCSSSSLSSSSTPFDFDPSKSSAKKQSNFNNNITNNSNLQQHPPYSSCYCFTCYTSYWARWDSSPNRQLIHEIIDAFEDNLVAQRKKKKQGLTRKEKRKHNKTSFDHHNNNNDNQVSDKIKVNDDVTRNGSDGSGRVGPELGRVDEQGGEDEDDDEKMVGDEMKQGSVRKIVSFIGERIWGSVWG